jgi:hypothetical protein
VDPVDHLLLAEGIDHLVNAFEPVGIVEDRLDAEFITSFDNWFRPIWNILWAHIGQIDDEPLQFPDRLVETMERGLSVGMSRGNQGTVVKAAADTIGIDPIHTGGFWQCGHFCFESIPIELV